MVLTRRHLRLLLPLSDAGTSPATEDVRQRPAVSKPRCTVQKTIWCDLGVLAEQRDPGLETRGLAPLICPNFDEK